MFNLQTSFRCPIPPPFVLSFVVFSHRDLESNTTLHLLLLLLLLLGVTTQWPGEEYRAATV